MEHRNGLSTNGCTVQLPSGRFCDAPSAPDMPFPICGEHAIKVTVRVNEIRDDVWAGNFNARAGEAMLKQWTPAVRHDVVYYLRIGDLIKIGYTSRLSHRLKAYPPNSVLLATEVGTTALEQQRHEQFGAYLASGKEWFTPSPELLSHIDALSAAAA